MRGLVASTDLEMESAETDEIMVSKENCFCLVDSVHLSQICPFQSSVKLKLIA